MKEWKSLIILGIIVLYAGLISAILYDQQKESPFSRHPVTDEEAYVTQAKGILDGTYPGERIFYQSPLYPYFLASVFYLFGDNYDAVRVFQSFFTLISIIVIYFLARQLFRQRVALIAAGLFALYGPVINYQVLLLKVNPFIIFLSLFLLTGVYLSKNPAGWWRWCTLGALCSFLLLLYDVMQLFLVVVPVWILSSFKDSSWKVKIARIMFFIVGAAIIVAPLMIRNKLVADELVISTSQGGANFFIGNNPIANGRYTVLPFVRPHPKTEEHDFRAEAEKRAGHTLKPTEVSGFWFRQGFIFIRNNPAKWFSLLWKKIRYYFGNYEIPDNHGFSFDRAHFLYALYLTPLSFGIIFALAVFGIRVTWRQWRTLLFLYIFLVVFTAAILAFFVVGRYRLPVVIGLIPFAAAGTAALWDQIRNKQMQLLITATVIIFTAAVFSFLPADVSHASWATEYYLLGNAFLKDADKDYTAGNKEIAKINARKADRYFNISLQLNPRNENAMKSQSYAQEILGTKPVLAAAGNSGNLLPEERTAPPSKDPSGFQRQVRVQNEFIDDSLTDPGKLLTKGKYDEVILRLKEDIAAHPDSAQAHFQLGLLFASREEIRSFGEAMKHLKKALEIDPKLADAWNVLGNIAYLSGNIDEARSYYLRALTLVPDSPAYKQNLALTYQSDLKKPQKKE